MAIELRALDNRCRSGEALRVPADAPARDRCGLLERTVPAVSAQYVQAGGTIPKISIETQCGA
jgi:hypothetical protein